MAHFNKYFTLSEANAELPWVRTIFTRVHGLVDKAQGAMPLPLGEAHEAHRKSSNGHANGNGHSNGNGKPKPETLSPTPGDHPQSTVFDPALDGQLSQLTQENLIKLAQGLLKAIVDRGIIVQDVARGLIDFPSWREGEEILLCYQLSDGAAIGFWHDLSAGFSGRQPIDETMGDAPE